MDEIKGTVRRMTYELILSDEAKEHMKSVAQVRAKEENAKRRLPIYLRNFNNIPPLAPGTLNSSKEIIPATGAEKSIKVTE